MLSQMHEIYVTWISFINKPHIAIYCIVDFVIGLSDYLLSWQFGTI